MGISESELFDKFDEVSNHFLFLEQERVIGSVRLHQIKNVIKLERMAIYKNFRNQDFGSEAALHLHLKGHDMTLADYYTKHLPRKNK